MRLVWPGTSICNSQASRSRLYFYQCAFPTTSPQCHFIKLSTYPTSIYLIATSVKGYGRTDSIVLGQHAVTTILEKKEWKGAGKHTVP